MCSPLPRVRYRCGQTWSAWATASSLRLISPVSAELRTLRPPSRALTFSLNRESQFFVITPSNIVSQLDSSSNSASGAWTDAGPLFSSGSADPSGSPSESNSSNSGSQRSGDQSIVTLVNQLINSPAMSIGSSSSLIDRPDPPAPTPEPRYSALALLGLGWTGLVVFRKFKTPRAVQRES